LPELDPSSQRFEQLRAEQVAALYRNAVPGTLGAVGAALVLTGMLVLQGSVSLVIGATFIALNVVHASGRLWLVRAYHRSTPLTTAWRRWGLRMSTSAVVGGLTWGLGSLLLMDRGHPELQLIVFLVCASLAAGAITAFGTYLPAYYGTLFSIMGPTAIWSAAQGDLLHWTYAVLTAIWIPAMAVMARTFNRMLAGSLRLQFENLDLATDARRQKERAEEANLAKSRFLASASHDLRQPVHALGMFMGALRGREMDHESRRLVGQIEGSIAALDGLFISLLDISRLDAGVIQIHRCPFPIHPLLERICREEAPEAARRGVELTLVPCSLNVSTDPILLERIVRNLVSNAVRHSGGDHVLVGCRRGERLSVEVRDSGRGIPADQQHLIFEEFYQIGNAERDRTKGLGLGLAIVRRLTAMLDIPLTLRSQPGKGSVFTLAVPIARLDELSPAEPADEPEVTSESRLILVIDDELAIQDAMRTLLMEWGHSVLVAGSGDEMFERVAGLSRRPDLVISDYRLRGSENGLDVIRRLRAALSNAIPAILITGDTSASRLGEAGASSCFLLHKPLSITKLRGAIAAMTSANGPAAPTPTAAP
jgi:two-component system, sensor histidine kinase